MKQLLLLLLLSSSISIGQSAYSDFEDGTLQNWTLTDGTTDGMSIVQNEMNSGHHLEKLCDGTNTAVGEMAIINTVDFNGDYTCYDPSGINCIAGLDAYVKNENGFDLNLRLGFKGANGTKIVSSLVTYENYPVGSDWYFIYADIGTGYTVVEGAGTIEDTFADVVEMRLINNENVSFDGAILTGSLKVDYITFIVLLSHQDSEIADLIVYPNPVQDILRVTSEENLESYRIYSVAGGLISEEKIENTNQFIDVSSLTTGVYFIEITSNDQKVMKKIIKR